ncbi:pectate lyase [Chitinophagaceae bacterium LB-8]|uniref:Pectate lyase n=1 Tax=Paraflavisolibacter caeni TaxID=2982496 RepID=A0A9X3BHF1_9BACT|nr:pectate lyase [Paraflavisolibacter caeni]MCU7548768.1 pectate lyase [Paraflavisolibacter caeni]
MKFILAAGMTLFISAALFAQDPIADNMLVYQRVIGGWPKHINEVKVDYTKQLSDQERTAITADSLRKDATLDNGATTKEIRYLLKAFSETGNQLYLVAAEKGICYLLSMQHKNGGWPQFYPDSSLYRSQITYNDNAMINAMNVLWDVVNRTKNFEAVSSSLIEPSEKAIANGIDCILKTQIRVGGKLTAWCTQYDKTTMQPAKARAFELPSISSMESGMILSFLMKVKNPSPEIRNAITSAIQWLDGSKIEGYNSVIIEDTNQPKGKDRILVSETGSIVWARFYDIDTNKPMFVGRDGIKRWNLAEIENERRVGYGWYGTWPKDLLKNEYPKWRAANMN